MTSPWITTYPLLTHQETLLYRVRKMLKACIFGFRTDISGMHLGIFNKVVPNYYLRIFVLICAKWTQFVAPVVLKLCKRHHTLYANNCLSLPLCEWHLLYLFFSISRGFLRCIAGHYLERTDCKPLLCQMILSDVCHNIYNCK